MTIIEEVQREKERYYAKKVLQILKDDIIATLIITFNKTMWAIIVGAVLMFIFGALWFTVLFGKMWGKLMELPQHVHDKMKS